MRDYDGLSVDGTCLSIAFLNQRPFTRTQHRRKAWPRHPPDSGLEGPHRM